jgi:PTS system mannose-specific IIA component
MIGVLIVTHGGLARELLAAGETINGALAGFEALSLAWSEGVEEAKRRIGESLARLDTGDGVLILTDMHGDTPSNAARTFASPGHVEVMTGVNLPMVVRLGCANAQAMRVGVLARWLQAKGRRAIHRAGDGGPAPTGTHRVRREDPSR